MSYQNSRARTESRKQEKRVAKELGGQTMAASGATRLGGGGDVRAPGYRVECKYTDADSYTLKISDLRKLKTVAFQHLEQPIMQIEFKGKEHGIFAVRRMRPDGSRDFYIHAGKSTSLKWVHLRQEIVFRGQRVFVLFDGEQGQEWEIITWEKFMEETKHADDQHDQ